MAVCTIDLGIRCDPQNHTMLLVEDQGGLNGRGSTECVWRWGGDSILQEWKLHQTECINHLRLCTWWWTHGGGMGLYGAGLVPGTNQECPPLMLQSYTRCASLWDSWVGLGFHEESETFWEFWGSLSTDRHRPRGEDWCTGLTQADCCVVSVEEDRETCCSKSCTMVSTYFIFTLKCKCEAA